MSIATSIEAGPTLKVNAPIVVSETRDGESIILHHGSGAFFDTSGSGAVIWQAIEDGSTLSGAVEALVAHYPASHEAAMAACRRFVAILASHDLLLESDAVLVSVGSEAMPSLGIPEPVLGVHTDLADMLLLDPIHDVDQAGWPVAIR
jgi:hypothetical protein